MDPTTAKVLAASAGALAKTGLPEAVVQATRAAVGEVWDTLFKPAATEIGLELQSRVAGWRLRNAERIASKLKARLPQDSEASVSIPPRLGIQLFDQSSLAEEEILQDMWVGLTLSSATHDGSDESNLMFTDLLSKLTGSQARVLEHACAHAKVGKTQAGLVVVLERLRMSAEEALRIGGLDDIFRLDRELDHLRSLELLWARSGLDWEQVGDEPLQAELTTTGLALQMYTRCKGGINPVDFYGLKEVAPITTPRIYPIFPMVG